MATSTTQNLSNLVINRVTSPEVFEEMLQTPNTIQPNEFYLVEGEETVVDWDDIQNKPNDFTPSSHTHGNITNAGEVTATATIANGDKLAIVDNSNSSKITGSTITFDGSTTTKALTQKGTWETFNNYTLPTAADSTLGGIKTNYSASGKNYAIKVDSNGNAYVNVPWTDNNTTSFTITANATDGLWDLTGTNGTNAVTYALAPYSSKKTSASFYTGTTNPTLDTRLNYDGYLYATKLYSGGSEVLTSHQSLDNYKTKQTAITDSTGTSETSTATRFVYSVSQNANGEISVKTRPLPTYAPLASPALTGTPTAPTATAGTNSTQIATTAFVANAVSQGFNANDAMVFKGTLGVTNGSVASLPANSYQAGWTYRVADAGTYAGDYCEVGDLIIAIADGPTSGSTVTNSHWAKIEHNIDGALYKTNSVTYSGNKVLMSSGTNGAVKEGTISNENVIKTITWSAGSATTLGTAIAADDITSWSAGTAPSLTITSVAADDITAWSDGTLPSLTITSVAADDITAWDAGSVTTASVSNGVLTITTGTASSLSYTARSIGSASGWSAGTKPSLSYTARSIGSASGWSAGTVPSLSYTARSIPNVTSAGTAPTLTTTTQSVITGIS